MNLDTINIKENAINVETCSRRAINNVIVNWINSLMDVMNPVELNRILFARITIQEMKQ